MANAQSRRPTGLAGLGESCFGGFGEMRGPCLVGKWDTCGPREISSMGKRRRVVPIKVMMTNEQRSRSKEGKKYFLGVRTKVGVYIILILPR